MRAYILICLTYKNIFASLVYALVPYYRSIYDQANALTILNNVHIRETYNLEKYLEKYKYLNIQLGITAWRETHSTKKNELT